MIHIFFYIALGIIITLLSYVFWQKRYGFGAQRARDYATLKPAFDIKSTLQGKLICEGMVYGPLGRVTSRFIAELDCRWEGDNATINEVFHYDNDNQQTREWRLQLDAKTGAFCADASDLIGTGQGKESGSCVCLRYRIKLPDSSGGYVLNVVDWLYRLQNGNIMNRIELRKYGIKVAEVIATLRKKEDC